MARSRKRCFSGLPGLGPHFRHSEVIELPLGWIRQSVVSWCRRPCDLIFCPLQIPKCNFVEVKEAIYKGINCPPELIFYLLTSRKWYIRDLEKARFQAVDVPLHIFLPFTLPKKRHWRCHESNYTCDYKALQSKILPHLRIKMRHLRGRENIHSSVQLALQTHFCLLPAENATLEKSRNRSFRPLKLIFSTLGGRNTSWMISTKRCFKVPTSLRNHFLPSKQPKMQLDWCQRSYIYKGIDCPLEITFYPLTRRIWYCNEWLMYKTRVYFRIEE